MYGLLRQSLDGLQRSSAPGAGWLSWTTVGRTVLLLGLTSLLTDGVLMAAASAELSERLRTSGLALLTTVTSIGSLVSVGPARASSWMGMQTAFATFAVMLGLATAWSAWTLVRRAET